MVTSKEIDKQQMRAQFMLCNENFDRDEEDKRNYCHEYVASCFAQDMENSSSFILSAESGYTIESNDLNNCLKMVPYMAGNFGGPASEIKRKLIKEVHGASSRIYDTFKLLEKADNAYYLDETEKIVAVDRFDNDIEKGFSPSRESEGFFDPATGERIQADDERLLTFLTKWGLPTFEFVDVKALVEYQKTFTSKSDQISDLIANNPEDYMSALKLFKELISAAKEVYPYSLGESNIGVIDERPDGSVGLALAKALGDNAIHFFELLGKAYAESGQVDEMDAAYSFLVDAAKNSSAALNTESINYVRGNGYALAMKKLLNSLENYRGIEISALEQGILTLEKYMDAKDIFSDLPLFDDQSVLFEIGRTEITLTELEQHIEALKTKFIVQKAHDITNQSSPSPLSESDLENIYALPMEYDLKDKSAARLALEKEISSNEKKSNYNSVQNLLKLARHAMKRNPKSGVNWMNMVTDPQWIDRIEKYLSAAKEKALTQFEENDPIFAEIEELRMDAYETIVEARLAEIQVQLEHSKRSTDEQWYLDTLRLTEITKDAVDISKLSENDKLTLQGKLDAAKQRTHKTMIFQLLKSVEASFSKNDISVEERAKNSSAKLERAEDILKGLDEPSLELALRISKLKSLINEENLDETCAQIDALINEMPLFDFMSAKENTYLMDVNKKVDDMIDRAGSDSSSKQYIKKAVRYRALAYEKYLKHHLEAANAILNGSGPVFKHSYESDWLKSLLYNLSLTEEYLTSEYNDKHILPEEYISNMQKSLVSKRSKAFLNEAYALEAECDRTTQSELYRSENVTWLENINAILEKVKLRIHESNIDEGSMEKEQEKVEEIRRQAYRTRIKEIQKKCLDEKSMEKIGVCFNEAVLLIDAHIPGSEEYLFSDEVRSDMLERINATKKKVEMRSTSAVPKGVE